MSNSNISQQQPMAVIKRPQHNIKLANVLNDMLQRGSLVDVTIYCDDGQVNAHKLVLAASSTYFRNLFNRMTNAFHYPIIVLREMPVNDLKTIIQFIYHDGMASSTNSLNAILASSSASMSHHPLLTAHSLGPTSTSTNNTLSANTASSTALTLGPNQQAPLNNKLHPQYLQANCKQSSRGGHSRSNNSNSNNFNQSSSNIITTNSNGKPKHTCPICLKTFTHGFTLKRHMKLHSQTRQNIFCDVCAKSYSCKDSFLRHKKSSGHMQHAEFHHRSIDMNLGSDR